MPIFRTRNKTAHADMWSCYKLLVKSMGRKWKDLDREGSEQEQGRRLYFKDGTMVRLWNITVTPPIGLSKFLGSIEIEYSIIPVEEQTHAEE